MSNAITAVVDDIWVQNVVLAIDFRYGPVGRVMAQFVGNLPVSATTNSDQHELPKAGTLMAVAASDAAVDEPLPAEGLFLGISRDVTSSGKAVVMVSLERPQARRFTLVAYGRLPPDLSTVPTAPGVKWAATLVARDGDEYANDAGTTHIGATLQVFTLEPQVAARTATGILSPFGGPFVQLGQGEASPVHGSPAEPVRLSDAFPDLRREFVLETDIDCDARTGRSRLRTPGHVFAERAWVFPSNLGSVSRVGVALAIAMGTGRTSVSFQELSVLAGHQVPVING